MTDLIYGRACNRTHAMLISFCVSFDFFTVSVSALLFQNIFLSWSALCGHHASLIFLSRGLALVTPLFLRSEESAVQGEGRKLIVMLTTSPHCCLIHCKKRKMHMCVIKILSTMHEATMLRKCVLVCAPYMHVCDNIATGLDKLGTCWPWQRVGTPEHAWTKLGTVLGQARGRWTGLQQACKMLGTGSSRLGTSLEQVGTCFPQA